MTAEENLFFAVQEMVGKGKTLQYCVKETLDSFVEANRDSLRMAEVESAKFYAICRGY